MKFVIELPFQLFLATVTRGWLISNLSKFIERFFVQDVGFLIFSVILWQVLSLFRRLFTLSVQSFVFNTTTARRLSTGKINKQINKSIGIINILYLPGFGLCL